MTDEEIMAALGRAGADHEELSALVSDYLDQKALAEKEAGKATDLADLILEKLPAGRRHEVVPGVGVMALRPRDEFNETTAEALLDEEDRKACMAFSWTAAKALLKARGTLAQCMDPGKGKPSLRRI